MEWINTPQPPDAYPEIFRRIVGGSAFKAINPFHPNSVIQYPIGNPLTEEVFLVLFQNSLVIHKIHFRDFTLVFSLEIPLIIITHSGWLFSPRNYFKTIKSIICIKKTESEANKDPTSSLVGKLFETE